MILPLKLNSSFSFSASAASISSLQRPYLSDYELITKPKYLLTQAKELLILSFTLQGMELMNEYSKHLEKEIEAKKNDKPYPEFDFDKALPLFFSKTYKRIIRNICNFLVKKCYEAICVASLPLSLSDRLTKDVAKSVVRKLERDGQQVAAQRIFVTCFYSSILRACALFTVDCGYALYEHFFVSVSEQPPPSSEKRRPKKRPRPSAAPALPPAPTTVASAALWTLRRALFHAVSIIFFSTGYSLGLMVHPKYTPLWFATICEAVGSPAVDQLLTWIAR
jgi:hypothetical protein